DEVIRLQPNDAAALDNRSLVRRDRGDLAGALQDCTEAIRLQPNVGAFNNRGLVRRDRGDLDGALQDFNETIRLEPNSAPAFYNRGIARQAKGDLDGARQDFAEADRIKNLSHRDNEKAPLTFKSAS